MEDLESRALVGPHLQILRTLGPTVDEGNPAPLRIPYAEKFKRGKHLLG